MKSMNGQDENTFDTVNTSTYPYCDDISCWCHNDSEYHSMVIEPSVGEEEIEVAYTFFGLEVVR